MQQIKEIKEIKNRINDAVMEAHANGQLGDIELINPLDLRSDPVNWHALVKAASPDMGNLASIVNDAALDAGANGCSVSITKPDEILGKDDGKTNCMITAEISLDDNDVIAKSPQDTLYSWNKVIGEMIRHFIHHHDKEHFVSNFGMPEWLAEHNVDTWANAGIEDLRDRAAWQLLEKIDNDKLVNYLNYLANERGWFSESNRSLVNSLIQKGAQ